MEIGIDTFVAANASKLTEKNSEIFEHLLERISFADKIGIDVYGIGEHHGMNMLDSAPNIILAAAASVTKRIRLTSAISGIGTIDPVRLFQEFSTIDLISNGRAEIIAGRGASIEAWALFGLNMKDSNEIFNEKLELLLKIRDNEIINWKGQYRSALDNIGIYPRPAQKSLPIWHAVLRTPSSAIRAGELGLPLMLAVIDGQIEQSVSIVELYKEAGLEAGFSNDELRVGFHSMGYVAESSEQAIEEFYPGWADSMTHMHAAPKTKSRFDIDLHSKGSTLMVGNPTEVAEKILSISDALGGISRFCFQMDYTNLPHEKLMNSIKLIGEQVIPKIKKHK